MKRRPLCLWGAAAALGATTNSRAQGKKSARIGVLSTVPRQDPYMRSMFSRLSDLGWSEWRNLKVEYRVVEPGATDIAPSVDAVVRSNCDLIVAATTPLALAVMSAAPSTPLVFAIGGDPVAIKLVTSMERPGGNATGWTIASHESGIKLIDLLRETVPRAKRFAAIFQSDNAASEQIYKALIVHATAAGVALQAFSVRDRKDIHALDPLWTREPVDGVIVPFEPVTVAVAGEIIRLAALQRAPAAYGSRFFVNAGGLLSYGVSWPAEVTRTADFVARILDGGKPADIPVERSTNFELIVNMRSARALGINVPQSVLAQATEVLG